MGREHNSKCLYQVLIDKKTFKKGSLIIKIFKSYFNCLNI